MFSRKYEKVPIEKLQEAIDGLAEIMERVESLQSELTHAKRVAEVLAEELSQNRITANTPDGPEYWHKAEWLIWADKVVRGGSDGTLESDS